MEETGEEGRKSSRAEKVRRIFLRFDGNHDGGLDRSEMAELVVAVNPRVEFSEEQISSILDEVFRTYSGFIIPDSGLTLNGLIRTYEDGAGDVDRDFEALGLSLDDPSPPLQEPQEETRLAGTWASSPNHGVRFKNTWKVLDELEGLVKKLRLQQLRKSALAGESSNTLESCSDAGWSREFSENHRILSWDEGTREFAVFRKELDGLRARVDALESREEAFDGFMAMGRGLHERSIFGEALTCFRRAREVIPGDIRAHFHAGNALHALGRHGEAKEEFLVSLATAESSGRQWADLLPQIHVNLGISMEGEGMLLGASEHYREAAILLPSHYRALKLLGSALFGVGEVRAAEKALEEAIFLRQDYADAHCDLGSVLHTLGEDERAIQEFQKAIDLKPGHVDALYNLGGLFMDIGRFPRASEMYTRVLAVRPDHWRAQLNKAVSLLGAGEADDARKSLQEAFKMSKRVELHDAIVHLKTLQRKKLLDGASSAGSGYLIIEPAKFRRVGRKTTARPDLEITLQIREFQIVSRLTFCRIEKLSEEMNKMEVPISYSGVGVPGKSIRKATLEVILRNLLQSLKPETFQEAIRAINERIFSVLDYSGSGRVDLGMFFAILAPLCSGALDKRKKAVFDALRLRPGNGTSIKKSDAIAYIKTLRAIYISSLDSSGGVLDVRGDSNETAISFSEFTDMFDDPEGGFGILSTLVKLEIGDRSRHGEHYCAVCRYRIIGSRFREVKLGFSLCSHCYSEGKVPSSLKSEEYGFKEYGSEAEALKDKCACI